MIDKILGYQGKEIRLWIPNYEVPQNAMQQLQECLYVPGVLSLCVMPDVHYGMGSTVGSVIVTSGDVMPAAVGVDVGCGMLAVPLGFKRNDIVWPEMFKIRKAIEAVVPCGVGKNHRDPVPGSENNWILQTYDDLSCHTELRSKHKGPIEFFNTALTQMGTLGSGNHFIELCEETEDSPGMPGNVWMMIHSGSRGIGMAIATHHIKLAKKLTRERKEHLPNLNLSYFIKDTEEWANYWHDLLWAQEYAFRNRLLMDDLIQEALSEILGIKINQPVAVHCHHNYAEPDKHPETKETIYVIRKGAIRARSTDSGIIPGSMGDRSYLVSGRGCTESFCSAPHGAGRAMSRTEAKQTFSLEDLTAQTDGVECRKDPGVLDEAPGAYKDIDQVMEYCGELVKVDVILKQFMNSKG